jgi:hypothetical protein
LPAAPRSAGSSVSTSCESQAVSASGAYDECIRHALTKMSHLHFTTKSEAAHESSSSLSSEGHSPFQETLPPWTSLPCSQSAARVAQMGEIPSRIFAIGNPGSVPNRMQLALVCRPVHTSGLRSTLSAVAPCPPISQRLGAYALSRAPGPPSAHHVSAQSSPYSAALIACATCLSGAGPSWPAS